MTIVAIIPARGGSKGVPRKNSRNMNGKPLVAWSIEQALAVPEVSRVIVSTDSENIAEIARQAGAEVPGLRPAHLAQDDTPTEPVLIHAIKTWCGDDIPGLVMLLQPTSPLRLPDSIGKAIEKLRRDEAQSLVSVCESHAFFWRNIGQPEALYDHRNRPRRQDIRPEDRWYRENGSIYLTETQTLLRERNRLAGKVSAYVMQECESWEIDSEIDFLIVEELMRRMNGDYRA